MRILSELRSRRSSLLATLAKRRCVCGQQVRQPTRSGMLSSALLATTGTTQSCLIEQLRHKKRLAEADQPVDRRRNWHAGTISTSQRRKYPANRQARRRQRYKNPTATSYGTLLLLLLVLSHTVLTPTEQTQAANNGGNSAASGCSE
ncbi:hypothetical protein BCR37DRAFT_53866 [Protomyces lactucae-debilis]|uniref:Uncharacterized protein n=1 Tax=Protomyces lactucae-debilis TaxID=2754530 RepID=A0A1Y2FA67_PROLT|nr:uncharacterized protein BCR37DRAFT_53866 [Protomyces lactucae-debilis]ORY80812.1 hypothetical protein BCR37DRAFT_53866 [Protomyces lactucae-debilis]